MIIETLREQFEGAVAIVQTETSRASLGTKESSWKGIVITKEPRRDRLSMKAGTIPVSGWVFGLNDLGDIISGRRPRDGWMIRMAASGMISWNSPGFPDMVALAADAYERGPHALSRSRARNEWELIERALTGARMTASSSDAAIVIMKSLDIILESTIVLAARWLPAPGNRISTLATIDPRLALAARDAANGRATAYRRFQALERYVSELRLVFPPPPLFSIRRERAERPGNPLQALFAPFALVKGLISGAIAWGPQSVSHLWPIFRLMSIMRPHWRIPLTMLGLNMAESLLALPITLLTAWLFRSNSPGAAYTAAAAIIGVILVNAIVSAVSEVYAASVTESVWVLWQERFVRRLMGMPAENLRKYPPGELDFRFTDARTAIELLIDIFVTGIEAFAFLLPAPFIIMLLPGLFAMQVLAVILILGVIYGIYSSFIYSYLEGVTRLRGRLSARMIEVLSALPSIKASRLTIPAAKRISTTATSLKNETVKLQAIIEVINVFLGTIAAVAPIILLVQAYLHVRSGTLDIGIALGVGVWFAIVVGPVKELFGLGPSIQRLSVRARRFLEIYDTSLIRESREQSRDTLKPFPPYARELRFEELTYSPTPTAPPLWRLKKKIPLEGLTAITGPSGAGKSTLLLLLNRTIFPTSGAVSIDRVRLQNIEPLSWRDNVAIVPQEDYIIEGTVMENLAIGLPLRPDALYCESILKKVGLWDRLQEREGLDTFLTPEGQGGGLSTGERKRLCLARALLRKPKLLLVDEMMDLVETELEDRLLATLREIAQTEGIRVIYVAHRPSAIAAADREVRLGGKEDPPPKQPANDTTPPAISSPPNDFGSP